MSLLDDYFSSLGLPRTRAFSSAGSAVGTPSRGQSVMIDGNDMDDDDDTPVPASVSKALQRSTDAAQLRRMMQEFNVPSDARSIGRTSGAGLLFDDAPSSALYATGSQMLSEEHLVVSRAAYAPAFSGGGGYRGELDPMEPGDNGYMVSGGGASIRSAASKYRTSTASLAVSEREPEYSALPQPHCLRDFSTADRSSSTASHLSSAQLPSYMLIDGASIGATISSRWDRTTALIDEATFEETEESAYDPLETPVDPTAAVSTDLSTFFASIVSPTKDQHEKFLKEKEAADIRAKKEMMERQRAAAAAAAANRTATTTLAAKKKAAEAAAAAASSATPPPPLPPPGVIDTDIAKNQKALQDYLYQLYLDDLKARGIAAPPTTTFVIPKPVMKAILHNPLNKGDIWDPFHSTGWWEQAKNVALVTETAKCVQTGVHQASGYPTFQDRLGNSNFGHLMVHPFRMWIVDYFLDIGVTKTDPRAKTVDKIFVEGLATPFAVEKLLIEKHGLPKTVPPLSMQHNIVYPQESGIVFVPYQWAPEEKEPEPEPGDKKGKKGKKDKDGKEKGDKGEKGEKKSKKDKGGDAASAADDGGGKKEKKEKKDKADKGDKKEKKDKKDKK